MSWQVKAKDRLSVRLILYIALTIVVVSGLSLAWTMERLKYRAEKDLNDKARVVATQFLAIRAFVAESQDCGCLPTSGEAVAQFKHLDPQAAEKGTRDLFGGDAQWSFKEIWFPGNNPRNTPDVFETRLIQEMGSHPETKEAWGVDVVNGQRVFRYLLSIRIEDPCLVCHSTDSAVHFREEVPRYALGDLAGAVSLSIPMTIFQENLRDETRAQMTVTGLMVMLSVATIFWVIRRLVDIPLTQLARAATEMGEGRLDHPLPDISVPAEIGQLSRELRSMALRLKDYYLNLENQVADRTRELSAANEVLKRHQEDLQAANIQLAKANRLKSEFLASVSHELRTPLTSIMAFVELLLEGIGGDINEQQREYLEDVLRGGQRLMTSINAILDMAKIEARKMELKRSTFDLAELVRDVEHRMVPVAIKKGLRLEVELEDLPAVNADRQKIEQVVVNLVSNAFKFTPTGGKVTVSACTGEGEVVVCVTDTGIGIKAEDQEIIFEAFRQVDGSSTRVHQGTGLGLALAKNLVEMHEGRIWVDSQWGVGSKFCFAIPLVKTETEVADRGQ
ncbi:hypothetical protein SY88_18035 [Clostridiales bacterium PH28_bin88]|nr:hypothetical protein SY88_18035 [Clostridiales bacterium PH28_bin88]